MKKYNYRVIFLVVSIFIIFLLNTVINPYLRRENINLTYSMDNILNKNDEDLNREISSGKKDNDFFKEISKNNNVVLIENENKENKYFYKVSLKGELNSLIDFYNRVDNLGKKLT